MPLPPGARPIGKLQPPGARACTPNAETPTTTLGRSLGLGDIARSVAEYARKKAESIPGERKLRRRAERDPDDKLRTAGDPLSGSGLSMLRIQRGTRSR